MNTAEAPGVTLRVPAATRRYVFKRDHAECQYQAADGKKCLSKFRLELDHIQPQFAGGSHDPGNLRLYCDQHNRFRYEKSK